MEEPIKVEIPPLPPKQEELPQIITHITEMTEEEREKVLGNCERARESYNRCIKEGFHYKGDWCKETCERKEKEEKERKEMLDRLSQRNVLLEQHGREMEAKVRKMEASMEKLAGLLSQLMPK